jgi:hypothetical protein
MKHRDLPLINHEIPKLTPSDPGVLLRFQWPLGGSDISDLQRDHPACFQGVPGNSRFVGQLEGVAIRTPKDSTKVDGLQVFEEWSVYDRWNKVTRATECQRL